MIDLSAPESGVHQLNSDKRFVLQNSGSKIFFFFLSWTLKWNVTL